MTAASPVIKIQVDTTAIPGAVSNANSALSRIGQGSGANGAQSTIQRLTMSLGAAGNAATRTAANTNTLGGAFGSLGSSAQLAASQLGGLNGTLSSLALAGASAGILAVAGALTYSVTAASGYLDKLAEISTLIDTTKFSMDALSTGLKEQAKLFGADPIAQAGAAYDIISSGASTAADAIATLNSANLLAAVGATTVGTAADGLTSVINAFASQTLTATQAADSMFITVRDGKISMEELSGSIGQVVPLASTLGLSLDDVGASVAALTLGGVKGSEAITGIRAALTAIIKPSAEASKLSKQIGLDFSSSALKAKGWSQFLDDVKTKTKGSQDQLAVLMGGVEGLSAVLGLTTTGAESFANSLDHMRDKSGTAAEALQKVQDASPGFQFQRVISALKTAAIDLGEGIASTLVPALKFMADHFDHAVIGAKALLATFLVYKGLSIGATFIQGATAMSMLGSAATALNTVMKAATAAQALFNAVVLANPIVAAAAALTGIIVLLYEFRDSISLGGDSVASLGDLFRAAWEGIGPVISSVIDGIKSGFSTAYNAVSSFLGTVIEVGAALGMPFAMALDGIKSLFSSAFGDLDFSISGILVGAARTADGLVGLFRGSLAAITVLWQGLPAAIGPEFQAILAGAKTVVSNIGNSIASVFNAIVAFGSSCVATLTSAFNAVSSFIQSWANKAIAGINMVLAGANKLGAGLTLLSEVKLGQIAPPKMAKTGFARLGADMGAAFKSGFGHEAENGVKSLLARAEQIGKKRTGAGAAAASGKPSTVASAASGVAGKSGNADKQNKAGADRLKQENDFWQALKDQATAAGMLAGAAEIYNKGLELRKVLSRDLTTDEQSRVATALSEINTNKAITTLKQAQFDAASEYTVELGRAKGLTEAQRSVEDDLFKYRLDALRKGVDINASAYTLAENDLKTQLDKNSALKVQNALLAKAGDFARKYSSTFDITSQLRDMDKQADAFKKAYSENGGVIDGQTVSQNIYDAILSGFNQARTELKNKPLIDALSTVAGGSVSARGKLDGINATTDFDKQKDALKASGAFGAAYDRQLREITQDHADRMMAANNLVANDFTDKFTNGIDELANIFGGAFGGILNKISDLARSLQSQADPKGPLSQFAGMFGSKLKKGFDDVSSKMQLTPQNIKAGLGKLSNPLGDLKSAFGKGGSITQGIGQAVGGAMAGYQIGSSIGGLGKALGIKGFSGGAKIGGTIGGLTGNPVIAAAASVVGGIVGSLLHKTKVGAATISDGLAENIKTSGNSGSRKEAASGLAASVQSGLADIAARLGGTVGAFGGITIGQRDKDYRVNTSGNSLKVKKGAVDFGDDAQAAVAYAVEQAIKRGAIVGISDFARKALSALDVDGAVALVDAFKSITTALDAMADPIGAAVRDINTPLASLVDQMKSVGASSADLSKVEEYRSKKIAELIKDQLADLSSFKKTLMGEGSGVTALDRLNAGLSEFKTYQQRIAAGDSSVDQSAFTALGQDIFSLARDVYGTATSPFQELRAMLINTTTDLEANVTKAANAANTTSTTDAAITAQTSAVVGQQVITNDLLRQILAKNGTVPITAPQLRAANGQVVDRGQLY